MNKLFIAALALFLPHAVFATDLPSPYAGQQMRHLKSLSEGQVNEYLEGKGMGLAKPAELNAYPGPAHVLELAEKLALTPGQKKATEVLHAAMQSEARRLGARYIQKESELESLFRAKQAESAVLKSKLSELGQLHAAIRHAHLSAHIAQRALLTPQQVALYDTLRGYGTGDSVEHRHEH